MFACVLAGCTKPKPASTTLAQQEKQKELQCYQMFTALKTLDHATFRRYQQQFSIINSNYEVYKKNQAFIKGDAAEIISMELNNKVDLVCARVRSAVFTSMATRANELNKL
ncbi:hypothetical protein M1D91_18060 [Enterobacter sp. SA197]